ncbi:hypothetical protein ACX0G7_16485 [Flavitalea antarctica]
MRNASLRTFPRVVRNFLLFIYINLAWSCEKVINRPDSLTEKPGIQSSNQSLSALSVTNEDDYCYEDREDGFAFDSVLKPTILGAQLIGAPYSVANMQQAKLNLTGTSAGISENKWYVRLKPTSHEQLAAIE